jgi:hypothetical protein
VSVVCCQVEVSATVLLSVVYLAECDLETSTVRMRKGALGLSSHEKNKISFLHLVICFAYTFLYLLVFPFLSVYILHLLILNFAFIFAHYFPFS